VAFLPGRIPVAAPAPALSVSPSPR
jgi:hypothetical protein